MDVLDVLVGLLRSGFGWRLVLSPRYRAAMRTQWDGGAGLHAGAEVAAGAMGLILSTCALVWLAATLA